MISLHAFKIHSSTFPSLNLEFLEQEMVDNTMLLSSLLLKISAMYPYLFPASSKHDII
jgi:hypothetical protein